jgi:hypothetical protein
VTAAPEVLSGRQHQRLQFSYSKEPVPILQEAGFVQDPVWRAGKSRPHQNSTSGPSSPQSVAMQTELIGPNLILIDFGKIKLRE